MRAAAQLIVICAATPTGATMATHSALDVGSQHYRKADHVPGSAPLMSSRRGPPQSRALSRRSPLEPSGAGRACHDPSTRTNSFNHAGKPPFESEPFEPTN